jgi:hypothetical protein
MKARRLTITFFALCGTLAFSMGGCGGAVDPKAEKALHDKLGSTSITVFPAFVRDGEQQRYDAAAATAIGDLLTSEKLATVTISTAEVPINSKWGMNESRMYRDSVADFRAYVLKNPIATEYAVLPEYLIGGKGAVVGVHLYLLDAKGTCAYGIGLNSHHKAFTDVDPKNVDDCTKIVLNVMKEELKPAGEGQ